MIFQNTPGAPAAMAKYGCTFTALAWYREKFMLVPWTLKELSDKWTTAMKRGIISGDLNGDGDVDDTGEAEIQDYGAIVKHLGLKLSFVGKVDLGHTKMPDEYLITAWRNPANGFVHWVVGKSKPVFFDPIEGGSRTVALGDPWELQRDGRGGQRLFRRIS